MKYRLPFPPVLPLTQENLMLWTKIGYMYGITNTDAETISQLAALDELDKLPFIPKVEASVLPPL